MILQRILVNRLPLTPGLFIAKKAPSHARLGRELMKKYTPLPLPQEEKEARGEDHDQKDSGNGSGRVSLRSRRKKKRNNETEEGLWQDHPGGHMSGSWRGTETGKQELSVIYAASL